MADTFDMNQCKPGDFVISKLGALFEYVGKWPQDQENIPKFMHSTLETFPHLLKVPYSQKNYVTRTDEGFVYSNKRLPEDHDIVGFYTDED